MTNDQFPSLPSTPQTPAHYLPGFVVGLACAILYLGVANGVIHGILIGYVPMLLVFGLGWLRGSKLAGSAVLTCAIAMLVMAPHILPAYLALDGLPCLIILRLSLTYFAIAPKGNMAQAHLISAFSTGQVLTLLSLYATVLIVIGLLVLQLGAGGAYSLPEPSVIIKDIAQSLTPLLRDAPTPEAVAEQIAPMLPWMLGVVLWLWVLAVWGCAALAYYLCSVIQQPAPRNLAITPFRVPVWLLGALAILGLVAGNSIGWNAIALKSVFLLLLLPYFLSGVATILPKLPAGTPRRLGIAGIVLGLFIFPFIALIFIAIGLLHPLQSRSPSA